MMVFIGGIMRTLLLAFIFSGCGSDGKGTDDTGAGGWDVGSEPASSLAPVDPPSNGSCPNIGESGTVNFVSSNEDRVVTMVVPEDPPENMPLVYFFHGLMDPGGTPNPTEYMASGLNLQSIADRLGVAFALPQSGVLSRMGFSFFMWNVEDVESADIVLFDDIRSCADSELGIDLRRVHAVGMSGGALFTTVVARDRGDALASMVEMSGGSDVDMLTFDSPLSAYSTPRYPTPALLISGGESDIWPGGGLTLVDFSAATDTLADRLVDDGHFVVRCEHGGGHSIPYAGMQAAELWIESHAFEEASPIETDGIDAYAEFDDWCTLLN